jgi:pimeloyl-ACP methyl ester carboxylesterase
MIYARREGHGRPLLLIHGIGMSHIAWDAVVSALARDREVIAMDLPGFGDSPALPANIQPTPAALAQALKQWLDEQGIGGPIDIAGNSLGGAIALEAGKQGWARSIAAISPAGFHRGESPKRIRLIFELFRLSQRRLPQLVAPLLRNPLLRTLAFQVPLAAKGWKVPADTAVQLSKVFAASPDFERVRKNIGVFSQREQLPMPVQIAFGRHDWLLTGDCQHLEGLPRHVRISRPRGWGHVPMWDDPKGVAAFILNATI